jgi:hypothetical protein
MIVKGGGRHLLLRLRLRLLRVLRLVSITRHGGGGLWNSRGCRKRWL